MRRSSSATSAGASSSFRSCNRRHFRFHVRNASRVAASSWSARCLAAMRCTSRDRTYALCHTPHVRPASRRAADNATAVLRCRSDVRRLLQPLHWRTARRSLRRATRDSRRSTRLPWVRRMSSATSHACMTRTTRRRSQAAFTAWPRCSATCQRRHHRSARLHFHSEWNTPAAAAKASRLWSSSSSVRHAAATLWTLSKPRRPM